MKVIAITKVHGTLNYLCMVQSKEGPVDWEFFPEVSLACPFRNISDAKRAINEKFPPISGTTHAVQYVFVFSLVRPLGSMRGQISQEMLDAVDPTKKDPDDPV